MPIGRFSHGVLRIERTAGARWKYRDKSSKSGSGCESEGRSSQSRKMVTAGPAPFSGCVSGKSGQRINEKGDRLVVMEAVENAESTVYAPLSGTVKKIAVSAHENVEARDLLLVI